MSNICVCIEGQLRGSEKCGENIKKYLIDYLKADLYFYLQNYELYNESDLKYYGEYKEKIVYDNPNPNFENIFDNLAEKFGYDKNIWRDTFTQLKERDQNFSLGYEKPGTCIRRMYNRYLIYEYFKDKNYDWYIISRSDFYFVDNFYDISNFNKNNLYVAELGDWGGINNNLIIFNKINFEKILTYIKTFLSGQFLNIVNNKIKIRSLRKFMKIINEEKFFMFNMEIANIQISKLQLLWYISGDEITNYTSWYPFKKSEIGDIYKYDYDYFYCQNYLQHIAV
jgi:hypothetical protein